MSPALPLDLCVWRCYGRLLLPTTSKQQRRQAGAATEAAARQQGTTAAASAAAAAAAATAARSCSWKSGCRLHGCSGWCAAQVEWRVAQLAGWLVQAEAVVMYHAASECSGSKLSMSACSAVCLPHLLPPCPPAGFLWCRRRSRHSRSCWRAWHGDWRGIQQSIELRSGTLHCCRCWTRTQFALSLPLGVPLSMTCKLFTCSSCCPVESTTSKQLQCQPCTHMLHSSTAAVLDALGHRAGTRDKGERHGGEGGLLLFLGPPERTPNSVALAGCDDQRMRSIVVARTTRRAQHTVASGERVRPQGGTRAGGTRCWCNPRWCTSLCSSGPHLHLAFSVARVVNPVQKLVGQH